MKISNSITKQEQIEQLEALLAGRSNPLKNDTNCEELSKALSATGSIIL